MWHTPMTKATTIQEHAATVGAMKAKKGSNGMENGKWSSTNNGVDKISCYLEKNREKFGYTILSDRMLLII